MSFLYAAMTIVLVHSFVPHQHHEELSIEDHNRQHREASNWMDYLLLAFHVSPNQGHLEEFQTTEAGIANADQVEFDACFLLASISFFPEINFVLPTQIQKAFTGDLLANTLILRGPPAHHNG